MLKNKRKSVLLLIEEFNLHYEQVNGCRYFGPRKEHLSNAPPVGSELFVGKLPQNCFEDDLYYFFSSIGPVYDIRLMVDFSGNNRGFSFVRYYNTENAKLAASKLNGGYLGVHLPHSVYVALSTDHRVLQLIGSISSSVTEEEVNMVYNVKSEGQLERVVKIEDGPPTKFLLSFVSHRAAAVVKRNHNVDCLPLHWGRPINLIWQHNADVERRIKEKKARDAQKRYFSLSQNCNSESTKNYLSEIEHQVAGIGGGNGAIKNFGSFVSAGPSNAAIGSSSSYPSHAQISLNLLSSQGQEHMKPYNAAIGSPTCSSFQQMGLDSHSKQTQVYASSANAAVAGPSSRFQSNGGQNMMKILSSNHAQGAHASFPTIDGPSSSQSYAQVRMNFPSNHDQVSMEEYSPSVTSNSTLASGSASGENPSDGDDFWESWETKYNDYKNFFLFDKSSDQDKENTSDSKETSGNNPNERNFGGNVQTDSSLRNTGGNMQNDSALMGRPIWGNGFMLKKRDNLRF